MKCPVCNGDGGWQDYFGEGTVVYEPCNYCNESTKVGILKWLKYQLMNRNGLCWFWGIDLKSYYKNIWLGFFCITWTGFFREFRVEFNPD